MDETRVQHGLSGQGAVDTVGDRRCPSVRLVTDIHVSGSAKDAKDDQDKCLALLIARPHHPRQRQRPYHNDQHEQTSTDDMVSTFPPHLGPSVAPSPQGPPTVLLPLSRPPPSTAPPHPDRPSLPASFNPPARWERTLHAAPATYPKQSRVSYGAHSRSSAPYGPEPTSKEPVEVRRKRFADEAKVIVKGNLEAEATQWKPEEIGQAQKVAGAGQWLSIERWRRLEPVEGGVTLVCAHANGLNKEVSGVSYRG